MKILSVSVVVLLASCGALFGQAQAIPLQALPVPRVTLNFNPGWKFIREDVKDAVNPTFDDSSWSDVSTPHSFNDVDSFRTIISHGGGDRGTFKGVVWYRKHFKVPADMSGDNLFLEFEGMRQAGDIFLNGKEIGLSENGVTAYGVEISRVVHFGDEDNLLAVQVDNRTSYQERETGTQFEWNANDFNPDHGGINRDVWLHVTGKIYQTLPINYGLGTQGVYVHAGNFDISNKTADVTVESEAKNESGSAANVALSVIIADGNHAVAAFSGQPVNIPDGGKTVLTVMSTAKDLQFWSPDDPHLYDVYTILSVGGKQVDVNKLTTGFRKTEFKGGAGTGGVFINDKFVYLKGYSQRSSDEWAALGGGVPDWLHDYSIRMMREDHGNYVRWMHVSPQRVDVEGCDKYGIVAVCPAGDKERDVQGRQWEQRAEVMHDSIIYFRNNPSILFYETGNTIITPPQMQEMVELRKKYDPFGGRVTGTRDNDQADANNALTPVSEYYGVMIGQDPRTDAVTTPGEIFRGYSVDRRDRAPLIESEDFRDEGARRFWDDFSPPYFGFEKGPNDTYQYTSESFALAQVKRYWAYWTNRISNSDPVHSKWSGYASIYFSDSDADGRQDSSEVCRVSGKVDAMRLPKEIYFAERVMQNPKPDAHILGHWNYPTGGDAKPTTKTIYVIANTQAVELIVNGKSAGVNSKPESGFIFAFPDVTFAPGALQALASNDGKVVAQEELKTAGAPAKLKLTPIVGPEGLQADGQDAALFDVEVVDADGQRCPTDDARIDFKLDGQAIWRGGYNSGKINSTNNTYLNTECGINRVAIRSTLTAGKITLTASRDGLQPASVTVESKPMEIKNGIATEMPQRLAAE